MSDENIIGTIADEGAEDAGRSSAEAPAGGSGGVERETSSIGGAEVQGGVAGTIADEESPEGEDVVGDGAPARTVEDYELEVDEATFPMPRENVASFTKACREAGLTRKQAEAVLAWHKGQYVDSQKWAGQERERAVAAWRQSILEDRDFGGANYKSTVADARKALRTFDPDGSLRKLLKQTGGEHHPDVIRAIARVGRQMGEHGFVGGGGGGAEKPKAPLWQRMYGK